MVEPKSLFDTIKNTICTIENELKNLDNKGVFFAPELFIAFCIGKDIFISRENIFGTQKIDWLRETYLGNGGPSDIIFKKDETYVVIELKLRSTIDAYKKDVEKLKKLPEAYEKFFCVLIDQIPENIDGRADRLETVYGSQVEKIGHYFFPTWPVTHKNIDCHLNLYKVI
jgi:Holliday junction resolvase-like predicted endonuclease